MRGDGDTPVVPDDAGDADVLVRVQIAGRHAAERDHKRHRTRVDQDADVGRMLPGHVLPDSAGYPVPHLGGLRLRHQRFPGLGAIRPQAAILAIDNKL